MIQRFAFPLLAVLVLAAAPVFGAERPLPRTIVLLSLDTTRADRLSAYGYDRPTTPILKRLAEQGTLVRRAVSPMPTTDPAHTSMLTGLYPRTHGVRINGQHVAQPSIATLASWAGGLGYRTGAFVSRGFLAPSQLSLGGFDHEEGPEAAERNGRDTLDLALAWLDENAGERLFLWVHFFDPHHPYEPPEPFASRFVAPGAPDAVSLGNAYNREAYTQEQVRAHSDRYDAEIAYTDSLIGELIERLTARTPEREAPLVAIVGDHGEAMGELDERYRFAFDHGKLLYRSILDIPLLFYWPGVIPAGRTLEGPAEVIDIAPTLADVLGVPGFENQGKSLWPYMQGEPEPDDWLAFSERRVVPFSKQLRFLAREQYAVQDRRYKLILSTPFARTELFDLEADPDEQSDVADELPEVEERLRNAIQQWRRATPTSGEWTTTIPAEKIELLRELGYIE